MKKILPLIALSLSCLFAFGQKFPEHAEKNAINEGPAILVNLGMGVHQPAADLADRFGITQSLGMGIDRISTKNYLLGIDGQFYFGNRVHDDPLAIIRTPEGGIIGNDKLIASVVLRQRAYYIGGHVGKMFPVGQKRQGIRLTLGAGVARHWIRVQDDTETVTQITGDYKKGYDRLTGGFAMNQFLGWEHLGWDRRINWSIGFEFNQGFTHTLRDWDFSAMQKLDGKRLDLRYGLRASWTLPFYQKGAERIYY